LPWFDDSDDSLQIVIGQAFNVQISRKLEMAPYRIFYPHFAVTNFVATHIPLFEGLMWMGNWNFGVALWRFRTSFGHKGCA
jgi:hypothetical protein